jgi:superfamily II DNA or RNA helicase
MTEALRRGDRVRIRGERWQVVACTDAIVRVRGCEAANRLTEAAFLGGIEQIQRIPRPSARIVTPKRWRHTARRVLADAVPSPTALRMATRAQIDLLPFQLEPALAWTRGEGVRLLIADEVGLGKTIQAGLLTSEVLARSPDAHVLVVTPAGLRDQWIDELRNRFALTVAMIDSAAMTRLSSAVLTGANPWATAPVSVTSIDFVKRAEVLRSMEPVIWDLVVFDEAHALSGHSDRATAAGLVAERARVLVLLSATPHSGDVDAFERLLTLGDIDGRFPLVAFRRTRRDAGFGGTRRSVWLRVRLTRIEHEVHGALEAYTRAIWSTRGLVDPGARLAARVLARRACSSAAALVRSLDRRLLLLQFGPVSAPQLHLPFDDDGAAEDAALGTPGLPDSVEERRVLEQLLALATTAASHESKPGALRRLLRRIAEPAIVFTEYRDTLEQLSRAFADLQPVVLHGGLPPSERRDVLRQFTNGHASLLLATDAASEGLNLQHRCRLVINLELPWSPVRLEQRVGRVERLGQTRRVHAVHLVARHTTEERTILSLFARLARAEGALASMRPPVGDDQIATAAITGMSLTSSVETPSAPLTACDLRDAARAEAVRVHRCRVLDNQAARHLDRRGVVAASRRASLTCCAYRLFLNDAGDEPCCERVIGITATIRSIGNNRLRVRLAGIESALAPWVERAATQAASTAAREGRAALDLALEREVAIAEMLRTRQSRMASELVQRGLFDTRSERAAAARTSVLAGALDTCERHVDRLRHRGRLVPAGGELAFALLSR